MYSALSVCAQVEAWLWFCLVIWESPRSNQIVLGFKKEIKEQERTDNGYWIGWEHKVNQRRAQSQRKRCNKTTKYLKRQLGLKLFQKRFTLINPIQSPLCTATPTYSNYTIRSNDDSFFSSKWKYWECFFFFFLKKLLCHTLTQMKYTV